MRTEIEKKATIAGWIDEARSEIKELEAGRHLSQVTGCPT